MATNDTTVVTVTFAIASLFSPEFRLGKLFLLAKVFRSSTDMPPTGCAQWQRAIANRLFMTREYAFRN